VALPARYRASLLSDNETSIIITRDPQYPSLKVYFGSEWENLSGYLKSLQSLDPIVRKLQWTILGNASVNEFDPSGRMLVLIPSELREYAEIDNKKKLCLVGMGNKFEIWEEENWSLRQTGGSLSTEILDVVLPETIKSMSF
jgi:MraZ protein